MNQRRIDAPGNLRQATSRKRVDVKRCDGISLGPVHVVVRRAVDDDVRLRDAYGVDNRSIAGKIEHFTALGHDPMTRFECLGDRASELSLGAGHQNGHRVRSFTTARVSLSISRRLMVSRLS